MAAGEEAAAAAASIKGTYADPGYWTERYAQPAGGGGGDDESQADAHFDCASFGGGAPGDARGAWHVARGAWRVGRRLRCSPSALLLKHRCRRRRRRCSPTTRANTRAGLASYDALQWWTDRFLPSQGVVLDMGCGNSELSAALARAHGPALAVVGIDYAPNLCARMRELHPGAELLVGDGCRLPLRDGAVDAVVDKGCLDSLLNGYDEVRQREKWGKPVSAAQRAARELHLGLGRAYLREMARVLAPGGHFLMISYEPPAGRLALLAELAEGGGGWEVVEAGAEDEPSGNYLYATCRRRDGGDGRPPLAANGGSLWEDLD